MWLYVQTELLRNLWLFQDEKDNTHGCMCVFGTITVRYQEKYLFRAQKTLWVFSEQVMNHHIKWQFLWFFYKKIRLIRVSVTLDAYRSCVWTTDVWMIIETDEIIIIFFRFLVSSFITEEYKEKSWYGPLAERAMQLTLNQFTGVRLLYGSQLIWYVFQ